MKMSNRRAGCSGRRIGMVSGIVVGLSLALPACGGRESTTAGAVIGSAEVTDTSAEPTSPTSASTSSTASTVPSTEITVPPSSSITTMTVPTTGTTGTTTAETPSTETQTTEPGRQVAGDVAEIRRLLEAVGPAGTVGVLISVEPDTPDARLDEIEAALAGTGSTVLSRGSVVPVINASLTMAGLDSLLASEATAAIDLDRAMTS